MTDLKPKLSTGIPVRLPEKLLLELKETAAQHQRSISQEIRYRVVQFSSKSNEDENNPT
jgi:hypothetical protein